MSIRAYEMIFQAFGVEYREKEGRVEAACPNCGTDWKLCIDKEKPAVFRCAKCDFSGNGMSLMYRLYSDVPETETSDDDWNRLSQRRNGLDVEFAYEAGVKRLPSGRWALPGFVSDERKTANLAFWNEKKFADAKTGKLKSSPVIWPADHYGYWTFGDLAASGAVVMVEGFWDGWAAKQLLSVDEACLDRIFGQSFGSVCVMAIPGVMGFQNHWRKYLKGKHVFFSFDDDKPDKMGRVASEEGYAKTAMMIVPYVQSMRKLSWERFKDALKLYSPKTTKLEAIKDLNDAFGKDWSDEQILDCWSKSFDDASLEPDPKSVSRTNLSDVLVDLRNYITTNPHTERTFVLCMAIVASSKNVDANPLWAFLFAPTGFGKTTLADCFEKSQYVHKEDAFRASTFVSGYKPAPGEEYESLASKINGKCLMVMEWTVNMTASADERARLNGVLRRLYEGEFRQQYGNGQVVDIRSKFSMLCCVTDAIRVQSTAHLGERFIRIDLCANPQGFSQDPEDEEEIEHIVRAIQNNVRGIEWTVSKKMIQLAVASYLEYVADKYREEPPVPAAFHRRIAYIAQITETLRFRSEKNEHGDVEEQQRTGVGTRLGTQFTRLMACVAMVLDKEVPDEECWTYIQRVATDSMSSLSFRICRLLYGFGRLPWLDVDKFCDYLSVTEPTVRKEMKALVEKGVCVTEVRKNRKNAFSGRVWALSPKFAKFWRLAKMESFDAFIHDREVRAGATQPPDSIDVPENQIVAPELPEHTSKYAVPPKPIDFADEIEDAAETPAKPVVRRLVVKTKQPSTEREFRVSNVVVNGHVVSKSVNGKPANGDANGSAKPRLVVKVKK